MNVFVVMNGERCEGALLVSVHESKERACEAALRVKAHFEGGWQDSGPDFWENGCDYVQILEVELLP